MCCHNIKSESRVQTFTFHTRPNPICGVDYVKLQSHWPCDESEKEPLVGLFCLLSCVHTSVHISSCDRKTSPGHSRHYLTSGMCVSTQETKRYRWTKKIRKKKNKQGKKAKKIFLFLPCFFILLTVPYPCKDDKMNIVSEKTLNGMFFVQLFSNQIHFLWATLTHIMHTST